jgi:hypothetical protein
MRPFRALLLAACVALPAGLLTVAPAQAAPVITDSASFFVADFGAPRVTARLSLSRTGTTTTYIVGWNTNSCVDTATTRLCTYVSREGTGTVTSGTVEFAPRAGGATVSAVTVAYTETRYSIESSLVDEDAMPVFTELGTSEGSTVVDGSLTPVGRAQVSPFRDTSNGTVNIQTYVNGAPTLTLFGTTYDPSSDDGSQLGSIRTV